MCILGVKTKSVYKSGNIRRLQSAVKYLLATGENRVSTRLSGGMNLRRSVAIRDIGYEESFGK